MEPASFDQANQVFDKPADMSYDECAALDTFKGNDTAGQPVVISCWKVTQAELEEIQRTGRIWCIHIGNYLQPHVLVAENPFEG